MQKKDIYFTHTNVQKKDTVTFMKNRVNVGEQEMEDDTEEETEVTEDHPKEDESMITDMRDGEIFHGSELPRHVSNQGPQVRYVQGPDWIVIGVGFGISEDKWKSQNHPVSKVRWARIQDLVKEYREE